MQDPGTGEDRHASGGLGIGQRRRRHLNQRAGAGQLAQAVEEVGAQMPFGMGDEAAETPVGELTNRVVEAVREWARSGFEQDPSPATPE